MQHNRVLADAVLVLHGLVVLFNIGTLPVIWIGYFRKWHFVRNPYFRWGHLLLLGFVLAETVCGLSCPLTLLEDALRVAGGESAGRQGGFVARWLQRLIFWDAPAAVFVGAYGLFFALVVFTFVRVRPEPFSRTRMGD
jgi:polyferredoxin